MRQHFRSLPLVVAEPGVGIGPRCPGNGVDVRYYLGGRRLRRGLPLGAEQTRREETYYENESAPTGAISMLGGHPKLLSSGV
jgi:hypothetical protein